jgi:hypothetical protein
MLKYLKQIGDTGTTFRVVSDARLGISKRFLDFGLDVVFGVRNKYSRLRVGVGF